MMQKYKDQISEALQRSGAKNTAAGKILGLIDDLLAKGDEAGNIVDKIVKDNFPTATPTTSKEPEKKPTK